MFHRLLGEGCEATAGLKGTLKIPEPRDRSAAGAERTPNITEPWDPDTAGLGGTPNPPLAMGRVLPISSGRPQPLHGLRLQGWGSHSSVRNSLNFLLKSVGPEAALCPTPHPAVGHNPMGRAGQFGALRVHFSSITVISCMFNDRAGLRSQQITAAFSTASLRAWRTGRDPPPRTQLMIVGMLSGCDNCTEQLLGMEPRAEAAVLTSSFLPLLEKSDFLLLFFGRRSGLQC